MKPETAKALYDFLLCLSMGKDHIGNASKHGAYLISNSAEILDELKSAFNKSVGNSEAPTEELKVLAEIREALGVGDEPALSELPGLVRLAVTNQRRYEWLRSKAIPLEDLEAFVALNQLDHIRNPAKFDALINEQMARDNNEPAEARQAKRQAIMQACGDKWVIGERGAVALFDHKAIPDAELPELGVVVEILFHDGQTGFATREPPFLPGCGWVWKGTTNSYPPGSPLIEAWRPIRGRDEP